MTLGTVTDRVNRVHYNASVGALTGAALGWCAPQWFGSIGQGAAMCALSRGTATAIVGVAKDTAQWLQPDQKNKTGAAYCIHVFSVIGSLVTLFTAAKGASYLGYTITWKQAALCGAATFCAYTAQTKMITGEERIRMPRRIPPAVWALAGFAAGKLAPQWITPIDGAILMGSLATGDMHWLHIWNTRGGSLNDEFDWDRDATALTLIGLTTQILPHGTSFPLGIAAGLFYAQRIAAKLILG